MRYQLTKEDRSKGGKRQPIEAKVEAGRKGFKTTMERHPWMFAHLKHAKGMKKFNGTFNPQRG